MSPLFRRRRSEDADELDDYDVDSGADRDEEVDGTFLVEPEHPRGPWDLDDVPADDVVRVDLGGLLVPVTEAVELRVEIQEDVVIGATVVRDASALQIHAFAAPRTTGIWAEVREELADSIRGAGGSAEDGSGRFGPELVAQIPADDGTRQPVRFVGVDGPRWFLRGLLSGPASTDPEQAQLLEELFAQVVVNRGKDAMAPRDQLPLRLPRDAQTTAPGGGGAADDLDPFERGPEITEIR